MVSSIVVALSLIGGWQFIAPNLTHITSDNQPSTHAKQDVASEIAKLESDMVAIKGGTFQMGSPKTEPERSNYEKQHKVTVADFQMGKYEVTQKQWRAIMDNNPPYFEGDDLPVAFVSWNDVQVFLSRLNQATEKTGRKFNLPTEAQWEYAARAGTNTPFYPYDGKGDCITTTYANFDSDSEDYNGCGANTKNSEKKTVAVSSYQPNAFGLYNMAGNVEEWTCSAFVNPYDGTETKCISKYNANTPLVVRGGSYGDRPVNLRSAYRYGALDGSNSYIGFRLSRM
jgi:formylglycine-generating enzyme required for sulfatase activity